MTQNCWEYKKCGRERGGANVGELGVCPAASIEAADGIHGGVNGGRVCWAIVDTLCSGSRQEDICAKLHNCSQCGFIPAVEREEGSLMSARMIFAQMKLPLPAAPCVCPEDDALHEVPQGLQARGRTS